MVAVVCDGQDAVSASLLLNRSRPQTSAQRAPWHLLACVGPMLLALRRLQQPLLSRNAGVAACRVVLY